jgi:hypothetical protein
MRPTSARIQIAPVERWNWLAHSAVAANPLNELKCSFIEP